MTLTTQCPHCQQAVSIPPGVLSRKRVQCPLCRGQFAVEVSQQSVKLLTGRAPGGTPLAPEAETPQRTRPLQPWEYRFDFAAIYGKTFSTYGTAFTASLFYSIFVFLVLLAIGIGMFIFAHLVSLLGVVGAIFILVALLILGLGLVPLSFGFTAACISIARGKGWEVGNFFEPYENFVGFVLWLLALGAVAIVFVAMAGG